MLLPPLIPCPADEQVEWIDPAGNVTPLSNPPSLYALFGRVGFGMPPIAFVNDEIPYQPGSALRTVKTPDREFDLPVLINLPTEAAFRALWRQLAAALYPANGQGTIRVYFPGLGVRDLYCRYQQGFVGDETQQDAYLVTHKVVLVFHAFDPFWHDVLPQSWAPQLAPFNVPFFPILPLGLSASGLGEGQTVNNPGDAAAWPIWTVQGPFSTLILTNKTTGETTELDTAVLAGRTLTINTSPLVKTCVLDDGTSLYGSLSADSAFWSLQAGANSVAISWDPTFGAPTVAMAFMPSYLAY